jgi:hypothetical protein
VRTPLVPVWLLAAMAATGACAKTHDQGLTSPEAGASPTGGSSGTDAGTAEDAPFTGCDGPACKHLALGSTCAQNDDCDSGSCADGVCCNLACDGACVSCNQPGSAGECLPVAAGATDPHGTCKDEGTSTCGLTGACNGKGGCARYAAGTMCKPSACAGGSMVPASSCDGRGSCLEGPAISCDPFMCGGTACLQTCGSDADCVAPATCVSGSCGKRGLGQACQSADQCKSGFCADGVCCSEACTGKCRFCALSVALGRCLDVPADVPDPRAARGVTDPALICAAQAPDSCGNNGLCDGSGGCQRYPQGMTCKAGQTCDPATNLYTGAFTCDGQGQCAPPAGQSCAPFKCSGNRCATGCASDADCAGGAVCQNGSCGKKAAGQLCGLGGECASGQCQQGVCCSTACAGTCMSCALPGSIGVCVAVPAGGADPTSTCKDQGPSGCGNDGTCNGSGACRKYPAGTVCAPSTCTGGSSTAPSTCNGSGACTAGASRSCAPYACNAAAHDCFNSCSDASQCAAGNQCQMNQCGKKAVGAPCTGATECTSGVCADGVCCNRACGTCESCGLGGSAGTCSPIPAGQSDPDGSCAPTCADGLSLQDRKCDGAGACQPFGAPAGCGAYACKQGRCLTSCAAAGDCATGNTCTAMTCTPPAKKALGAACLAGSDCTSGNCVDKTCCSTVSCGTCLTCANAAGTCMPAAANTACGPASCSVDNKSTIAPTCSVAGLCLPGAPVSCGNYVCSNGACKTSCANDADCVAGRCRGFKCR